MKAIDLSDYNLAELKGLLFDIDREIRERQRKEREQARARILAIAENAGVAVDRLLPGPNDQ
jgi:DNA-binding protein H-NS